MSGKGAYELSVEKELNNFLNWWLRKVIFQQRLEGGDLGRPIKRVKQEYRWERMMVGDTMVAVMFFRGAESQ